MDWAGLAMLWHAVDVINLGSPDGSEGFGIPAQGASPDIARLRLSVLCTKGIRGLFDGFMNHHGLYEFSMFHHCHAEAIAKDGPAWIWHTG